MCIPILLRLLAAFTLPVSGQEKGRNCFVYSVYSAQDLGRELVALKITHSKVYIYIYIYLLSWKHLVVIYVPRSSQKGCVI